MSLRYEGDDDVERYLVGSIEERRDDLAVISPASPLGQALLGHRAGDQVEYQAPRGTSRSRSSRSRADRRGRLEMDGADRTAAATSRVVELGRG